MRARALFVQTGAPNLLSAALRLMPPGQIEAQRVLAQLLALWRRVAAGTEAAPLDTIGSASPAADIAALRREMLAL